MHHSRPLLLSVAGLCQFNFSLSLCQKKGELKNVKPFHFQHESTKPSKDAFYIKHSANSTSASSFSIAYDVSRRSPKWVMEHLRKPELCEEHEEGRTVDIPSGINAAHTLDNTSDSSAGQRRRHSRPSFHVEHAIDVGKFRTNSVMYSNSGYDRGWFILWCMDGMRYRYTGIIMLSII